MSPRVVAQRYAQALFDLSQRQNNLEEIVTQVEALLNLYRESRLLRNILETPIYTASRKIAWLRPPFEKTLPSPTLELPPAADSAAPGIPPQ